MAAEQHEGVPFGLLWGVALWAVAGMLVMRSALGAPIILDMMAFQSLVGHLAYGLVLGVAYALLPAARPAPERAKPSA